MIASLVDSLSYEVLTSGGDKQEPTTAKLSQAERSFQNAAFPLLSHDSASMNPALGLRAVRLSLRNRPGFREQLKGILLASAHGPVQLLIPFVTTLDEIREVRREIEIVMDDLRGEGRSFDSELPVGMMIETPAAAIMADVFAHEVDFFAIGTNDLVQYVLAADRGDDEVAYLYRPANPALLRILKFVLEAAFANNRPVSLCGEMAADPFFTPLLVGLGISSLSMSPMSIPVVKRMVRRLHVGKCREFAREALKLTTADEVESQLAERLKQWTPDLFAA